ncbi:hypothetical protein BGW38_003911 [Lunasporangiospora selenospora]|uniref:Uncharacterized protein n=1 Tax=Lunasporangiospora selenospora TaxID=979761 RepID=A0A9P6FQ04_9FUNG|nr:hypothetical protein BGW38_003911 [Lunasporangiospora selenospora]
MHSSIPRPHFIFRKRFTTLYVVPLAITILFLAAISPNGLPLIGSAAAAPITPAPVISKECHQCLSKELLKVPKCDKLDSNTPAPDQTDPAKIQAYMTLYSDEVECLCSAALQIQNDDDSWIETCGSECTAAVFREKKKVFATYSKIFSCGEPVKDNVVETPAKDVPPTTTEEKDKSDSKSSKEKDFFADSDDDDFW